MTDLTAPLIPFAPPASAQRLLRWLHERSFAVLPERIAIGAGLRGALAVVVWVIACARAHEPLLAWAAFAAFWTCLGDPTGRLAARARTMALFAVGGAVVATGFAGLASGGPLVGLAALFVLVLGCGAVGHRYPALDLIATLVAVVGAVALEQPITVADMPWVATAFVGGGGLAMVLLLGICPEPASLHARRTLARVFDDLSAMAVELARCDARSLPRCQREHRRAVRRSLDRASNEVTRLGADPHADSLRASRQSASGVLAALQRLARVRPGADGGVATEVVAMLGLAGALSGALRRQALGDPAARAALQDWAKAAGRRAAHGDPQLAPHLAEWRKLAALALRPGAASPPDRPAPKPPAAGSKAFTRADQAALLRRALAVVAVYALGHWQHLVTIQWATMAALVVSHGSSRTGASNWPRACERMLGSMIGGAAALALASLPTALPLQFAEVFVFAAATLAVRQVNYTLFVCFLTPLFVLVAGMILPGPGAPTLAVARAADNLLGSLGAALGCGLLLLPHPGRLNPVTHQR